MQNMPRERDNLVFTVRLFSEITIKSVSVRKRWTKILCQNIRTLGRQLHERTVVVQDWDRIEVRVADKSAQTRAAFIDLLSRTPGITNFSEVSAYPFVSLEDIMQKALEAWREGLVGATFSVRVKRSGRHSFSSGDVERYVGAGLNANIATGGVQLKSPDVVVHIEIKDEFYYIVSSKHGGLGGFPLGTQDPVLSLVSGGFDSSVASFQMIKRGMRTHFCFFNLGGRAHELGVKEISYFLWRRYGSSHRVGFITVPFEAVVAEIMTHISPANMGVVLKRMMLRAAERVAQRAGIEALVTGEAISQVSSQTIPNLSAIDRVTNMMVLRPLIATAKPDIIQQARDIGVEAFASNIPEYCGVISVKPSAKVNLKHLEEEEAGLDFGVLDRALADSVRVSIEQVMKANQVAPDIEKVDVAAALPEGAVVIDIRHPDERQIRPLRLANNDILEIPFYTLNTAFENLDSARSYFLYCERGVMSELHVLHLIDLGYHNVKIYHPQ